MSKPVRVQIPVSETDDALFKAAARKAGLPLAEWARVHLRERATTELEHATMTPKEAFEAICSLDAPVADVDTMLDESTRDRYR
jgi:hypothetical protein